MALTVPVNGSLNAAGLPQAAIQQNTSYTTNGFNCDVTQTQFPLQLGVPLQSLYTFNVNPAEVNSSCIAQDQTAPTSGSFYVTLNTAPTYSLTDADVNTVSRIVRYNDNSAVQFDCERGLSLSFYEEDGITATTTDIATTVVVQALDYRGVPMTIAHYIAASSSAVSFGNPVSTILSVQFANTPFSDSTKTLSLGNNSTIGLPYYLQRYNDVLSVNWGGVPLRASTYGSEGSFLGITGGSDWRDQSATNLANPNYMCGLNSNANTGYMSSPTRGSVVLQQSSGTNLAPTGNNAFAITYFVAGSDSEVNANIQNLNESALSLNNIQGVTSSDDTVTYAWPYLVQGDLTGLQWYMPSLTATTISTTGALSTISGDVPTLAAYAATLTQLAL